MAGLSKLHGLRHAYAQERYRELTGWNAPANGGPAAVHISIEDDFFASHKVAGI
ncbi:hypothetical protein GCM10027217_41860 [Pseudomaricurvus hydrocarbonicus]